MSDETGPSDDGRSAIFERNIDVVSIGFARGFHLLPESMTDDEVRTTYGYSWARLNFSELTPGA